MDGHVLGKEENPYMGEDYGTYGCGNVGEDCIGDVCALLLVPLFTYWSFSSYQLVTKSSSLTHRCLLSQILNYVHGKSLVIFVLFDQDYFALGHLTTLTGN